MIVGQLRGIEFQRHEISILGDERIATYWTSEDAEQDDIYDLFGDVVESLDLMNKGESDAAYLGARYLDTLTEEGEDFRQRWVDYVPQEA